MELLSFPRLLLSLFLLVNTYQFISGSDVQGDCSKDGSCEEKHGKEKYTVKGIYINKVDATSLPCHCER